MPSTVISDIIVLLLCLVIPWHVCVDCDRYFGSMEIIKFLKKSKILKNEGRYCSINCSLY